MWRVYDTVEPAWTWRELNALMAAAGDGTLSGFVEGISRFLNTAGDPIIVFPSARKALQVALQALAKVGRDQVLLNAFNCPRVFDSIVAAGLQPVRFDFGDMPGLHDWDKVTEKLSDRTAAVIITHYFGVPVDFRPITGHCQAKGIPVIEDCAHCLGGLIGSKKAGTLGDMALFSFNYDKPLALGWGGMMRIGSALSQRIGPFPALAPMESQKEAALLQQLKRAQHQRRQRVRNPMRFISRVTQRIRPADAPSDLAAGDNAMGNCQGLLGALCLERHVDIVARRNANAERLGNECRLETWPVEAGVTPAWLRQKVNAGTAEHLETLTRRLRLRGYRVGNLNWAQCVPERSVNEFPVAAQAAQLWLDVPVHQALTPTALGELIRGLNRP